MRPRDHVEWQAALDRALARGRATEPDSSLRRAALADIKALGFTEGQAIEMLARKSPNPLH